MKFPLLHAVFHTSSYLLKYYALVLGFQTHPCPRLLAVWIHGQAVTVVVAAIAVVTVGLTVVGLSAEMVGQAAQVPLPMGEATHRASGAVSE